MRIRKQVMAGLAWVASAGVAVAFAAQNVRCADAAARESGQAASIEGPLTLDAFRDVARGATPGVVNINTSKVLKRSRRHDPFWDYFFGNPGLERFFGPGLDEPRTQRSLGSGFVVDAEGYILTNNHVVDGADEIWVTFADQKRYEAKLVGRDQRTDVSLLKIEPKEPLTVLPLGDSDEVEVGQWVVAIGNPFGLGGNSVTAGVVSYKGRPFDLGRRRTPIEMLQTDAAINPGNSGGPLLDLRGRVVGINTLIVTQGVGQSAGVGFAVPIDVAKQILPQLREKGRVVRGWLGVLVQPVTEELARTFGMKEARGAIVAEVTPGSPAKDAGVRAEDVVLAVDGRAIREGGELSSIIASRPPGTKVRLSVRRDGVEKEIEVTLGTFPDEEAMDPEEAAGGRIGMSLRDLTPDLATRLDLPRDLQGVAVTNVEAGGAAEEAGLRPRDVIVSVGGSEVASVAAFEREIDRARPHRVARLRVRRGAAYLLLAIEVPVAR
jgi:serine protease Do